MTVDELIQRVAAQPVVTIQQTVGGLSPKFEGLLAEGKAISLAEAMADPDRQERMQTFRYAHILDPGSGANDIRAWQDKHPEHPLPADLTQFLERVNGIHLWADLESSRAYFGILPLDEWQDASEEDWAVMFESPPVGQLSISYHDNGDNYLILDTRGPEYLWYDLEDFDRPRLVASTVEELLDFWWEETAWLDPRQEGDAS